MEAALNRAGFTVTKRELHNPEQSPLDSNPLSCILILPLLRGHFLRVVCGWGVPPCTWRAFPEAQFNVVIIVLKALVVVEHPQGTSPSLSKHNNPPPLAVARPGRPTPGDH